MVNPQERFFREYFRGSEHVVNLTLAESCLWCSKDISLRAVFRDSICFRASKLASLNCCEFASILLNDGSLASLVSSSYFEECAVLEASRS